jgi:hypothetical protein
VNEFSWDDKQAGAQMFLKSIVQSEVVKVMYRTYGMYEMFNHVSVFSYPEIVKLFHVTFFFFEMGAKSFAPIY